MQRSEAANNEYKIRSFHNYQDRARVSQFTCQSGIPPHGIRGQTLQGCHVDRDVTSPRNISAISLEWLFFRAGAAGTRNVNICAKYGNCGNYVFARRSIQGNADEVVIATTTWLYDCRGLSPVARDGTTDFHQRRLAAIPQRVTHAITGFRPPQQAGAQRVHGSPQGQGLRYLATASAGRIDSLNTTAVIMRRGDNNRHARMDRLHDHAGLHHDNAAALEDSAAPSQRSHSPANANTPPSRRRTYCGTFAPSTSHHL